MGIPSNSVRLSEKVVANRLRIDHVHIHLNLICTTNVLLENYVSN